jgi:arabinogalactan endo-1,4-beta-galactosidase
MSNKECRIKTALGILIFCIGAAGCSAEFLIGADLSGLALKEEQGALYFDDGKEEDALDIFKDTGWNTIRLRLFLDADGRWGAINDLDHTLKMARRVKKEGFKLLLDLHYSDTWADPAHQHKPKEWENLSFRQLKKQVEEYTEEVITAFKKKDCLPDYVQIGNEIAPGILWPEGRVGGDEYNNPQQWEKLGDLLKAGVRGLRAVDRGKKVQIVLHVHSGGDAQGTDWFFSHIEEQNVPYDIIALSYYPWMHGPFQALEENLEQLGDKYRKRVIIAETAYPHRELKDKNQKFELEFPAMPEGQSEFLVRLKKTVQAMPDEKGLGIFYWFPEAIPVKGENVWLSGATALFDKNGNALPAISILSE